MISAASTLTEEKPYNAVSYLISGGDHHVRVPLSFADAPIYVSYFAGGSERNLKRIIKNALGFILGFTVVFVLLGALAGTFGRLLREHQVIVNIITGLIVIFFGLNFLGVFKLTLFKGTKGAKPTIWGSSPPFCSASSSRSAGRPASALSSVGADARHKPGQHAGRRRDAAAVFFGARDPVFRQRDLIDRLKGAFTFIKKHYRVINIVSGAFLVVIGVLMATGLFGRFLALLS